MISAVYPLIFAVYLIHDNDYVRDLLWARLRVAESADSPWMVLYVAGCAAVIFVVCCAVEWVRKKLFSLLRIDETAGRLCDRLQNAVEERLERLGNE